jgi:hypothetical protein
MAEDELQAQYAEYLQRATQHAQMAAVPVGQYAKVKGRLVRKLSLSEFTERWVEYRDLLAAYNESMERGDTVNDAVVQILEERATELLLRPS